MTHCRICGKPIKNDDAQFGPDCTILYRQALDLIETSEVEIGALFLLDDATVQKWLAKMRSALIWALKTKSGTKMKHLEFARYAIARARVEANTERPRLELVA